MANIPVIFRIERDGTPLAVFPTIPAAYSGYHMTCYAHVGQHGSCSETYYLEDTFPAQYGQYASLLEELREIYERDGDTLVVRTVNCAAYRKIFFDECRRMSNA